jgi:hypothetical protein
MTSMYPHHEPSNPVLNLTSPLLQSEDGIYLDELPLGAVIDVETAHRTYRVENRGDGKVLISGHPTYCPEPILVDLHGSTNGGAMLKMGFIGRGMRIEFQHPERGVIFTSPVREIRELTISH